MVVEISKRILKTQPMGLAFRRREKMRTQAFGFDLTSSIEGATVPRDGKAADDAGLKVEGEGFKSGCVKYEMFARSSRAEIKSADEHTELDSRGEWSWRWKSGCCQ